MSGNWAGVDVRAKAKRLRRQLRDLRREVKACCLEIDAALVILAELMQKPTNGERGENVAIVANAIGIAKDSLWKFGLGRKLPVRRKP